MSQSKSYRCSATTYPQLITSTKKWLTTEGFNSQQLRVEDGGILIQIEKTAKWKKFIGMNTALNIVFREVNGQINVEIGAGKWADKAAVGAISIVILWPLALTASMGAWQQAKMPERIFSYIAEYLAKNN